MVLFTVVPLFIVVYYALPDSAGNFTLDKLVTVSGYGSVFARSLLLALISTVVCQMCIRDSSKVTTYCENEAANLIFSSFAGRAENCGVPLNIQAHIPQLISCLLYTSRCGYRCRRLPQRMGDSR